MTAPTVPGCRCTHPKAAHDDPAMRPQCTARGCTCVLYRPVGGSAAPSSLTAARPVVRPVAPATSREPEIAVRGERGPSLEQVLAAGKRSEFKRTVQLTERIALLIHDLRGRLTDERDHAEERRRGEEQRAAARAEVQRLERLLADAKAKLTTKPRTTPGQAPDNSRTSAQAHRCTRDGCERTFATSQSRALHERRAHDGFNPAAKAG